MEEVFTMLDDLYLEVPFTEKDAAKELGTKWDAEHKQWYAPRLGDALKYKKWWSFLDVPFEEKDSAKDLGAQFHGGFKKWYVPEDKNFDTFKKWWPPVCRQYLFDDRFVCIDHLKIEGGQADVFKAEELGSGKHSAVKVFKPTTGVETGKDKEGLNREWKALEKLRGHKNILELLTYGDHDATGRFYLVTPWQNLTLAAYMKEEREAASWLTTFDHILSGVLDGLIYAFDNEIIHRDLKPDNIFLDHTSDEDDKPYIPVIGDFGVSKIKDTPPLDVTFVMGGSEPWTPWRDFRNRSDELQHQNTYDVYSWGAIAVALMTQAFPTSYDELRDLLDTKFKNNVDHQLHEYMSRCISLEPETRPKDVRELQEEILKLNGLFAE